MILTLTNHKGGVGKTTTALELLYGLHDKGYKTLGIDLDSQCNFTKLLEVDNSKTSITTLLNKENTLEEVIHSTKAGDFIPCTKSLSNIVNGLNPLEVSFFLKENLAPVSSKYDYIIIDTPPAFSTIINSAYGVSDYLLIPAGADSLSEEGFLDIQEEYENIKKRINPNLKVMGVVITRVKNGNFPKYMIDEFEEKAQKSFNAPVFNTLIRDSVKIHEAHFFKQSIYEYLKTKENNENVTNDYMDLVKEIENYGQK